MFFCDTCAERRCWPESMFKSYGPCEVCGETRECNEVPSDALPAGLSDELGQLTEEPERE